MMTVHGFNENGYIDATIDGLQLSIPDNIENRHRQMLLEWEKEGNVIPPFKPPELKLPNLEPDQFWFIVRVSGYEMALKDWMVSLAETDPVAWAAASSKLEYAKFFERDHPFVEMAAEAIEIDPVELDALWQYGAES